jgi:hypothetical protein
LSIFVSVPTLKDPEILTTITSAFNNADDPSSISMGVAAFVDEEFYKDLVHHTSNIKNLFIDRYDEEINTGVGVGRIYAKLRYDGQDMFLQVDSHTYFDKGWDTAVSILWKDALNDTKNSKTVVSGYLPPYTKQDGSVCKDEGYFRYSIFTKDLGCIDWNKVSWIDMPLYKFYKTEKRFIPATKVSGTFILSDYQYAENSGHVYNTKLFDEEIIQSIELLSSGYSLVFPNVNIPIFHFYGDPRRQTTKSTLKEMEVAIEMYLEENPIKCKMWEEYAQVNLMDSTFKKWYIPKTYRGELCQSL